MAHFVRDGHNAAFRLNIAPKHPGTNPHGERRPTTGHAAEHRQAWINEHTDGLGRLVVDELDIQVPTSVAHGLDPQVGGALDVGAVAGGVVKVEGVVADARVVVTRERKPRNVQLLPPLELRLQRFAFAAVRLNINVRVRGRCTP